MFVLFRMIGLHGQDFPLVACTRGDLKFTVDPLQAIFSTKDNSSLKLARFLNE